MGPTRSSGRRRLEGSSLPTIPELRPNLKASGEYRWHSARRAIAIGQHDLTLLPYVGPEQRAQAMTEGITRWDDAGLSGRQLGLRGEERHRVDAVLAANRAPDSDPLWPQTVTSNVGNWLAQQPGDVFVTVETVTDQGDDFTRLPQCNAIAMVYLIAWGWIDASGLWQTRHIVARNLTAAAQGELIESWRHELEQLGDRLGLPVGKLRLFHWSLPADIRSPSPLWGGSGRGLNWFDLLENVIYKEPVAVRGAFDFKLIDMATALARAGAIETSLGDLPALPNQALSAMAAAWSAAAEATELGCLLEQTFAIEPVLQYASACCHAMMQIVSLLRRRASRVAAQAA